MAQTGAFFPLFAKLQPRFGTPSNAVLLQTALSLAVLFLGAFDRVLAYIIFSAVLFLALTASPLFRMSDRVRAWWFPWAPAVFIGFCLAIGMLILLNNTLPALAGIGLVLCGLPLHKFLTTRPGTAPLTPEGN